MNCLLVELYDLLSLKIDGNHMGSAGMLLLGSNYFCMYEMLVPVWLEENWIFYSIRLTHYISDYLKHVLFVDGLIVHFIVLWISDKKKFWKKMVSYKK